jgi:predicted glycosyltransferase
MGNSDRARLMKKSKKNPSIVISEFIPDLRPYLKAADVVVTMCGYNTAAEILTYKPQAIVVPRTWRYGEFANRSRSRQEHEQIIRARALARFGFVHLIEPEDLNARQLSERISEIMKSPGRKSRKKINVQGVKKAVHEIIKTVSA